MIEAERICPKLDNGLKEINAISLNRKRKYPTVTRYSTTLREDRLISEDATNTILPAYRPFSCDTFTYRRADSFCSPTVDPVSPDPVDPSVTPDADIDSPFAARTGDRTGSSITCKRENASPEVMQCPFPVNDAAETIRVLPIPNIPKPQTEKTDKLHDARDLLISGTVHDSMIEGSMGGAMCVDMGGNMGGAMGVMGGAIDIQLNTYTERSSAGSSYPLSFNPRMVGVFPSQDDLKVS